MELSPNDRVFVTGATGLVGSHVAERFRERGLAVRALVRSTSDVSMLEKRGVEIVRGDLTDSKSMERAMADARAVVHCAAKVGDWGPVEEYRRVNVEGLRALLEAARNSTSLGRFVHISSLGVYEARDHYGTDESEPPHPAGIDGYTLSKAEGEALVQQFHREHGVPAVILRPGFIYGPRDRTVLPNLLGKLVLGKVKYLGSGEQLMNNTAVGNLVDAVELAISHDNCLGEIYNITDGRLVTKREFMETIARMTGYDAPRKSVPLPVAKALAKCMETVWRWRKKDEAPLLSSARIKFLGLNLDFSIDKARRELGYEPRVDFESGMQEAIDWCMRPVSVVRRQ